MRASLDPDRRLRAASGSPDRDITAAERNAPTNYIQLMNNVKSVPIFIPVQPK
jgi:hypothetical protein